MRQNSAWNDDRSALAFDQAVMLVDEIQRLRAELARCESRIAELDKLAHQDPLVGVANRRSFLSNLERVIARVLRHRGGAALLFVDVDGLKAINDTFGHPTGDQALKQVAELLVATVRKSDCVGRLGGDEFGITIEPANELSAWQMALRIIETVEDCRFCVDHISLPLSVAVGVATIRAGDTAELVLARADKEMYRIKTIGDLKNR